MKIRPNNAGRATMICPGCRTPISVEFAEEDEDTGAMGNAANEAPSDEVDFTSILAPGPLPAPTSRQEDAPVNADFRPTALPPPKRRTKEPRPSASQTLPDPRKGAAPAKVQLADQSAKGVVPAETEEAQDFRSRLRQMDAAHTLKIRHRRRSSSDRVRLADWDTTDLDHIPEAELAADEWAVAPPELLPEEVVPTDSRQYVTRVDVVDGKKVERIKRVQKRKLLRGVQLAFNRMTLTMRWLVLAVLAFIASAGIWLLIRHFRSRAEAAPTQEVRQESPAAAAVREEVSIDNMDSSQKLIHDYLAAPNWQEKLKFVRLPDKTRPKMENWYRSHPDGPISTAEFVTIKKGKINNSYFVFVAMRIGPEHVMRYFAVEEIRQPDGQMQYLLDWETSTGYQPMEIYDFRNKQPKDPMEFRVNVRPGNYYNHGFADETKWAAYTLTYPGDPDFELIGYVEIGSPLHADLRDQLLVEANLILKLRYPEKAISADQVLIQEIVHRSWYYDDPAATAKAGHSTAAP